MQGSGLTRCDGAIATGATDENHDASRGIRLPQNSGPLSDPADAGTLERKASAMGQQPEADGTAGPPNETVCSEGHGRLISDWRPSPPRPSGSRFGVERVGHGR